MVHFQSQGILKASDQVNMPTCWVLNTGPYSLSLALTQNIETPGLKAPLPHPPPPPQTTSYSLQILKRDSVKKKKNRGGPNGEPTCGVAEAASSETKGLACFPWKAGRGRLPRSLGWKQEGGIWLCPWCCASRTWVPSRSVDGHCRPCLLQAGGD